MGVSFTEGVRLGALIHDIGKIHIPAEILSKPTKLTDLEYSLIKGHARVGYEILKDIRFPWPVAEIAYQHHETYGWQLLSQLPERKRNMPGGENRGSRRCG